jgi:hypothetical protein
MSLVNDPTMAGFAYAPPEALGETVVWPALILWAFVLPVSRADDPRDPVIWLAWLHPGKVANER